MQRVLTLCLFLGACAGGHTPPNTAVETQAEEQKTTPNGLGLDEIASDMESALDRETQPCDDFYQFACGGWLEKKKLPDDMSRYTRSFTSIYERNQLFMRNVLERVAAEPGEDADLQKLAAVYQGCMDEESIEAAGITPLTPLWEQIDAVSDLKGLSYLWGVLSGTGVSSPIAMAVYGDFKNPDLNILHMGQGGLTLPDRSYYLATDEKGLALLTQYREHIAKMFTLAGTPEGESAELATQIVALETKFATAHIPRAEQRDPEANYHRLEREGAKALFKHLVLDEYFRGAGYDVQPINVERPEVYERLDTVLGAADLDLLKAYTRWHVLVEVANSLSKSFVEEQFTFFGKQLRGQSEIRPRWKRCTGLAENHLGDVLSKVYVGEMFAGSSKSKAEEMILDIEHAFEEGLPSLSWMDEETRARAVEKVGTLKNKIGYPKAWRDFSGLEVSTGGHFEQALAMKRFSSKFWMDKVGNPVDKEEWFMPASAVNAYYNPLNNEMAFPAGILQPPFFHKDYPAALNYGAVGMVMGHELTHGFDDSGAKFAPDGKMVQWWAPESTERFEEKTTCVEKQYDGFEVLPGLNLNGKLTLGENIADLGGIKLTHAAYKAWVKRNTPETEMAGFSGEQQLFVGFAQSWCTLMTDEMKKERAATDSHSNAKWRVNGPLMNLPAFGEVFECEVGSPMRPDPKDTCEVW